MTKFILRRAASSAIVLVLSVVTVFLSIRILPGDPVLLKYGAQTGATPAALDALRESAGLNHPMLVQLMIWLGGVVRGDFGTSFISQLPVSELVGQRIPATLELTFFIVVIASILSVLLVLIAIRKPGSATDRFIGYVTSIGFSTPSFIIGIVLVYIFALRWHILPSQGFKSMDLGIVQNLKLMILPAFTGAMVVSPYLIKYLRTSILETRVSSYVRTAKGKGLSSSAVLFRHILPNSIVPTLTMLGMIVGFALGGVFVIEYMFAVPGIGS
ncbi:MAG: ABC transporter permease subunit, partial [Actinobacteria bacterium]|nr:ABC transporter permease subunit [Actinomycetota bacterium]